MLVEDARDGSHDPHASAKRRRKEERPATRCIAAHLPDKMYWQLRQLSAVKQIEMRELISQAFNQLFASNNMPTV